MRTGRAPNSINANVVLIRRKKPMNMKDCSWISFQRRAPTILFSSLVDNYLDDMKTRLKPTTIKNKRVSYKNEAGSILRGKLQICNIDAEVIKKVAECAD